MWYPTLICDGTCIMHEVHIMFEDDMQLVSLSATFVWLSCARITVSWCYIQTHTWIYTLEFTRDRLLRCANCGYAYTPVDFHIACLRYWEWTGSSRKLIISVSFELQASRWRRYLYLELDWELELTCKYLSRNCFSWTISQSILLVLGTTR